MPNANSPENMWIKFFTNAGLPSGISASYALTFTENRIQMNMLLDLNKEYLREMGIACMGDVIAILRHAKLVHEETARDRVLGSMSTVKTAVSAAPRKIVQTEPTNVTTTKPRVPIRYSPDSSTRFRNPSPEPIVKTQKKIETPPIVATKRKIVSQNMPSANIKSNEEVKMDAPFKVKKMTHNQQGVHDKPILEKRLSDVFSRLGSSTESQNDDTHSTGDSMNASKSNVDRSTIQTNVFSRLGDKSTDVKTPIIKKIVKNHDSFGQQERISNVPTLNKIVIRTNGNTRMLSKTTPTMQADRKPVNIREKLSLKSSQKSVKFSPHVDCKLIEKRTMKLPVQHASVANAVLAHVRSAHFKNMPNRNVAVKNNVKLRLGNTTGITKKGVFGRLGLNAKIS